MDPFTLINLVLAIGYYLRAWSVQVRCCVLSPNSLHMNNLKPYNAKRFSVENFCSFRRFIGNRKTEPLEYHQISLVEAWKNPLNMVATCNFVHHVLNTQLIGTSPTVSPTLQNATAYRSLRLSSFLHVSTSPRKEDQESTWGAAVLGTNRKSFSAITNNLCYCKSFPQ